MWFILESLVSLASFLFQIYNIALFQRLFLAALVVFSQFAIAYSDFFPDALERVSRACDNVIVLVTYLYSVRYGIARVFIIVA